MKLYGWYLWRAGQMAQMVEDGMTFAELADYWWLSAYQARMIVKAYHARP